MSTGDSLIEECTNGTTRAGLYLSRLGLEKEIKNPNKPGKPKFSVPELGDLWEATNLKANTIAATYNSRKAIREALRRRDICLDEVARDCLVGYGPKIWNNGREVPFVLSLDTTTTPSKIKGHAQVAEDKYLRHLIYEHPSDARKIRLLVSAWIVQRACRKAEYDRREGKTPQKEAVKSSTDCSSFIDTVRVRSNKRNRSTILASSYSSASSDELVVLGFEDPAKPLVGFKHAVQLDAARKPQSKGPRQTDDSRHTSAKRHKKQTAVAVVIPARKPQPSDPTKTPSKKHTQGEPLGNRKTVPRPAQSRRKGLARGTLRLTTECRTTPRRTRTGTRSERSVQSSADANMNLLAAQLDRDRNAMGIELDDLLLPHNPGSHNLAAIKRTIGLIDTIAINDAQGLRRKLGDSYEKHRIALDRWLGCVKALVEFREITNLEGDENVIEAKFSSLPLPIKRKARLLRQRKHQEIVSWFKRPAVKELDFTIASFSRDVASILSKMTSWSGLPEMGLDEILDPMVPFTKQLLGWFRGVPISSTTRN
ncbi:hypothetical protein AG0111_0g1721 [Alternaria gaisen]|uniref:Uncharacterized protein n=1 Tax=Alternaria gaisen TaxID=167740 RepID=A0ACB6G2Q4_9PLEO|nr:hypothetical protein AG0111_0g1721 [Alternaria gaisen]